MQIRLIVAVVLLAFPFSAQAWDKHRSLMPTVLGTIPGGSAEEALLNRPLKAPCPDTDRAMYHRLATELQLNPSPKDGVLPTSAEACARKQPITGKEILLGFAVDEPDFGMDQDLPFPPESYDPQGFQKWMGGTQGPTSQGFRHMYFGGWQLWHPINTFQIPTGPLGVAPDRASLMARKARELIHTDDPERVAWGFRVLGWALHYVQDLTQPFHSTQIPSPEMVPWYVALQWPPKQGFEELVRETTRTISNYHFAYESFTWLRITAQTSERSPYLECLDQPDSLAPLRKDPRLESSLNELGREPLLLATRTARSSVQLAPRMGRAVVGFFGPRLKERGVDLPRNQGMPDYADMLLRPDLVEKREELKDATCGALANASWASRAMIAWVLAP